VGDFTIFEKAEWRIEMARNNLALAHNRQRWWHFGTKVDKAEAQLRQAIHEFYNMYK
jgi:hypothetical protein